MSDVRCCRILSGLLVFLLPVAGAFAESSAYQQRMQYIRARDQAQLGAIRQRMQYYKVRDQAQLAAIRQRMKATNQRQQAALGNYTYSGNSSTSSVTASSYRGYSKSFYSQGSTVQAKPSTRSHSRSNGPAVEGKLLSSINAVRWENAQEGNTRTTREWHGFPIPSWVVRYKVVEDPDRKLHGYPRIKDYVLLTDPESKGGNRVNEYPRRAKPPKPRPSGPTKNAPDKGKGGKLFPAPPIKNIKDKR